MLACALAAGLALPFHAVIDLSATVMLFLLTVVVVAVLAGRGPAVLASLCNVALFDFLFVPPRFSFAVSHAQHLATFAVMLAVSLIVGQLTAGLRRQAQDAERRELATRALYDLARTLAGAAAVAQVGAAVAAFLRGQWGGRSGLLLPDADGGLAAPGPAEAALDPADLASAREARDGGRPVVRVVAEGWRCHCLPLSGTLRGVLCVRLPEAVGEAGPLLEAVASLVGTAVERLHFVELAQAARLEAESERLRSSILSALSHDVRTPLTALYGMADALAVGATMLPAPARETAIAIRGQALRVNEMVDKLLDMARLQAGRLALRREWQPVEEVVGASLNLLGAALDGHPLRVEGIAELPLLEFDAVLMERVFCNLFENAAKYSPPGATIRLAGAAAADVVELRVCSGGDGFPPDKLRRVFELFERGSTETAVPGMGVGLAICRSIVEAHGGTIRAFNLPDGGGCVAFTLPRGCPPPIESEAPAAGDDMEGP